MLPSTVCRIVVIGIGRTCWARSVTRIGHGTVREVASAVFDKALVQRMEQVERVGMAVISRPRRAAHRRPESGEHVCQLMAIDHPVVEAEIAGLHPHPLHQRVARFELGLA